MATTPQAKSKSPTIRRILREAAELSSAPSADYTASPLETDVLEWHFTLRGPPNSVYSEGLYHGRIVLPSTYPLRPPSFRFLTPNGRFETNREICLSISGHHEETWQPAWGIRTALVALRSFMETDAKGQLGGLEAADEVRKRLAADSGAFRCATCGQTSAEIIRDTEALCASQQEKEVGNDPEIPPELRMAWRDDLHDAPDAVPKKHPVVDSLQQSSQAAGDDTTTAELAEGFVQTAGPPSLSTDLTAQSLRRTTAERTPAAVQGLQQQQAQFQAHTEAPQGVPYWIDRLIVVLVVLLVALLLKIMFDV